MKDTNNCSFEKKGSIGVLSINNPPENFIKDPAFISAQQYDLILGDSSLKGLIITGSGRHFSAGADLKNLRILAKDESLLSSRIRQGKGIISAIEKLNIPVVAAVRGVCFGAGLEIALACHIRICGENSLFAFPETSHNIIPGLGGTVMLAKLIGEGRAAELILSGEMIDAQRALEIRLVDYITGKNELLPFALSYLERLTSDREIPVINSVMKSIYNSQILSFEDALEEETKLFCSLVVRNMKNDRQ